MLITVWGTNGTLSDVFTSVIRCSNTEWHNAPQALKEQTVLDWSWDQTPRTPESTEECTVVLINGLLYKATAVLNIWVSLVDKLEISGDFQFIPASLKC